ncbi:tetratricopeptide repeat-containing hybrid sensor histidine kinase/response regulator [Zunongwangia sp. HRR-M8]|uniref:tetratricopeptide repeat-containing hybrid sensor histidine kinase/response regulator n=1 Tax=Zunongwangia sp. HRR-M8 TaxID=3015170 RepID=UPI0022DE56B7|nr:response regulator [Zunongwangia sp. HRR-M8]WBL23256.1 response regulator [Zunongwangia sp. HRR-M8]
MDAQVSNDSLENLLNTSVQYLDNHNYHKGIQSAMNIIGLAGDNNYYLYHAHNNLGTAYEELRDTTRAKSHYKKSLKYATAANDDTLLMWAFNNLGNIYSESNRDYQKGIAYYNRVIDLAIKLDNKEELIAPNINIAWTYLDKNQSSKAKKYLDNATKILENRPLSYINAEVNTLYGRYFLALNEVDSARVYFENSVEIVDRDSLEYEGAEAYKWYAEMLFRNGNYKEAFSALKKQNIYESIVSDYQKTTQIQAANARFDVNQYQKNLELVKKDKQYQQKIIEKSNEKLILLVVAAIVLSIILIFLYKINSSRKILINELKEKNLELQKSKEASERLSNLKTQFFSTVSHELRTPLYGVIGLTTLLLEDKSLKDHKNDLKSLKFSADYLLALINDVLQINKMESKEAKLEYISFHLGDLLESITKTLEFTRIQNKNTIHLKIDQDVPQFLIGDSVRLSQIMVNLMGNALKFTERGNIWVRVKCLSATSEQCKLRFEVEDDGIGIPQSKQKEIFQEFSQIKPANYNYQGTGLGLPIVKKMLKLFESDIHLNSIENKGSNFSFEIYLQIDKEKVVLPQLEINNANNSISEEMQKDLKSRILIVDDNRINQIVTKRILEQKNFECEIAQNGNEAVEKVRNGNFDLILMDVNMPGITGMEATRKIREFNELIPVIALTAVEVEEFREEIHSAGMNDIIIKPYDTQKFYQVVYRNILPVTL